MISKLEHLKCGFRKDIHEGALLETSSRVRLRELNRVMLTDEFACLLEEIFAPGLFAAAQTLRTRSSFTREDGTPLNCTRLNIDFWCKN